MNESRKILRFKFTPLRFFLILAVSLGGIYFAYRSGTDPDTYRNDFNVYYFAASEVLEGRTPYEKSLGEWTPYLYPPLLAELLAPITVLPLPVAAYLWFLLNAFSLFIALRMSARLVFPDEPEGKDSPANGKVMTEKTTRKEPHRRLAVVITCLILLRFILDNFDYGQVNLCVTALAVAHIYFWVNGKRLPAAIVLACAVAIKITPILLLVFHIAKLRLKYAISCLALIAALMALSFLPFGSQAGKAFDELFFRTIANGQGFNLAYHGNQSLQGAVERISGKIEVTNPSRPHIRAIAMGFLALAIIAAILRRNELLASLPFFCLIVLLSPLSWKQHFVMLLLPIAFLVSEALRLPELRMKRLLFVTLFMVFALFNLTSPKIIGLAAAQWCEAHSSVFLGALLVFFVITAISLNLSRREFTRND